ncbi:DUF829-domain-containing protein [Hypoxylon fragiforme]|uniref:DUF829-domain-containing protein n=1 Tax=Hypoxylon fragiforme TaxID=63214 RepID=UPI0020C66701|nr:DUF829-domain-containing protein [Hypoxylon fragiforme]KAI2603567.1 DUF829-domain-containing protein [Hypoxylon fragiforme]
MAVKPSFPGFTPISDRIFLRNEDSKLGSIAEEKPPVDHPTTIVVYGWGDGTPKNVAKYVDGYHKLFPAARILMVISSTFAASFPSLEQRTEVMLPLVDVVFPTAGDRAEEEKVLFHIMSNTGGIYAAATLNAFQHRHGRHRRLPHHLCVNDSTPGSVVFATEVGRWSRAMALGTAKLFPWPFALTHALWWVFLYAVHLVERARGREASGVYSCRAFLDHGMATPRAPRLYLYSKADDLIWWEDVEMQAEAARGKGYAAVLERFEDSPHVGHMRVHPQRYWGAIERCWRESMAMEGV